MHNSVRRVLFVTHNVPRHEGDAAGSFVLRLAVGLQARDVRVDVIAPGAPGLPPRGNVEGVAIRRVRYASESRMTLAYTGNMAEAVMGSWSGRLALLQLLWATRHAVRDAITDARRSGAPYDVVHVHWWFPAGLALLGDVRPDDPPMMITMHGSDIRLAERKTIIHPVLRRVFRQAAMRTAVSSWLRDLALQMAPDGDIVVAPMPVDTRLLLDAPVPGKREGLLFVGRLNAQKGLTDLLSALTLPPLSGVVLHVVGDGADREALQQQALHLGIASRVHWHGQLPQPALIPRYRAARAVVMPSRGEGLGLVAVEAQLCGTPVVAYDNGGVVDVVRSDFGGTLVPTGDVAALAAAIARVIASDEQVQHLGQAAREDMLARFTPQAVASRYLELYDQARSSRSGQAGGALIAPQGRP